MTTRSGLGLALLLVLAAAGVFLLGPLVWLLGAVVLVVSVAIDVMLDGESDEVGPDAPSNGPACGAPNDPDASVCGACDGARS